MTPETVFNELRAQDKAQLLIDSVAMSPALVIEEFREWAELEMVPQFHELLYDVQDAIMPELKRRGREVEG
jgi:alkanesulfonate monooxygenase SsuD/methylene tetrahydromethanopterin reductase-like flavin-dependent oxidoreductase (luciferase family)